MPNRRLEAEPGLPQRSIGEQKAEMAKQIETAVIEVAGATPSTAGVKFSDSSKTDFIIGESE